MTYADDDDDDSMGAGTTAVFCPTKDESENPTDKRDTANAEDKNNGKYDVDIKNFNNDSRRNNDCKNHSSSNNSNDNQSDDADQVLDANLFGRSPGCSQQTLEDQAAGLDPTVLADLLAATARLSSASAERKATCDVFCCG